MLPMFTRHACMHAYVNRFNKYSSWSRGIITCAHDDWGAADRADYEIKDCVEPPSGSWAHIMSVWCDSENGKKNAQTKCSVFNSCWLWINSRFSSFSFFLFHLWLEDNFQSVFFLLWQTSLVCLSFISLMERRKCINIYNTLLWGAHIYISCASLWGELDLSLMWNKTTFFSSFPILPYVNELNNQKKNPNRRKKDSSLSAALESNEMLFHVCKCLPGRGSHLTLLLLLNRINNGERTEWIAK